MPIHAPFWGGHMLFFSHIWDLVLKLTSLLGLMIVLASQHADERLARLGVPPGYTVFVVIALATIAWCVAYRQGLSTIAAWLYANVNLGARVSLAEAHRLARLFQLDLTLKWVPLKEVRRLPRAERRAALLRALSALGPARRAMLL